MRSLRCTRLLPGKRGWALALAAIGVLACSEHSGVTNPAAPELPGPVSHDLMVSAPVTGRPGTTVRAAGLADTAADQVVYVSLPPASFPAGVRAKVLNRASGQSIIAPILDGGVDPVSIGAAVGDTLAVTITGPGGVITETLIRVPARHPPMVTRTIPPHRGTDVPLNSVIIIVFNEPIDSASANGTSLELLRGTTPVTGTVSFADSAHTAVAITPTAALAPNTAYRLVVSTAITDRLGSALERAVGADFTTGATTTGPVASIAVLPETATVTLGSSVQFVAVARDAQGAVLYAQAVTWSSSEDAVAAVAADGRVSTHGFGPATISAAAGGKVGTARITVTSAVSIASITVTPPSATIALGDSVQLTAVARDALGRAVVGALISWGTSDHDVVAVSQSGLVRTLGPGTATVEAFGGPMAGPNYGSARITVTLASVASVTVSPDTATIELLDTLRLTAVVRNAQGTRLTGAPVTWTSFAGAVATVDSAGLVSARGPGTATITATSAGKVGAAHIVVPTPPTPTGLVFASLSAGADHACGITTAGRAWCWGGNGAGQLGDSATRASTTPVAVSGGYAFQAISAGAFFTCGVTTSNTAYCWGDNSYGALGNGSLVSSSTPVAVVGGQSFASVSAGSGFACGVTTSRLAWCWGANNVGVLGNGTYVNSSTPVAVAGGLAFASVAAGAGYACGVTTTERAYCWGNNYFGNLGNGDLSRTNQASPVAVAGGLTFASLSAGLFACGATTSGGSVCWGAANFPTVAAPLQFYDQADDWWYDYFPAPTPVDASPPLTTFALADYLYCGLTAAGDAHCWGEGGSGALGDGGSTPWSMVPRRVVGGLTFDVLSAGGTFACGVTTGGVAYCWGDNSRGQLGAGTTANSSVPIKVAGQP